MPIENTLSIIKPDATKRNITGSINKVIEDNNLRIIAQKRIKLSVEQAENATTLNNFKYEKNANYAFVFGNEINGVSQKVINASDEVIEIPQYGTKHSFNISVSSISSSN